MECLEQGSGLVPNVEPDVFAVAPQFDSTEELRVEIDESDETRPVRYTSDVRLILHTKDLASRAGLAVASKFGQSKQSASQIQQIMDRARQSTPAKLGAFDVLAVRDYKADTRKDLKTGEVTATGLPSSNVLYYELSDNAWCCVRPSGTEPKIKFYVGVKGDTLDGADQMLEELKAEVLKHFE